jgi:hypothetical protein
MEFRSYGTEIFVFYIISFHGLGNKKKIREKESNFQQKIDGNFHFRILGKTSVPDFR